MSGQHLNGLQRNLCVLFLLDSIDTGGTETHVFTLAKCMVHSGHRVIIAGADGAMAPMFESLGCPVYRMPNPNLSDSSGLVKKAYENSMRQILQLEAVDVVHMHQAPSSRMVLPLTVELGIPIIATVHGMYFPVDLLRDMTQAGTLLISVSIPIQQSLLAQDISSLLIPNGIDPTRFHRLGSTAAKTFRSKIGVPRDKPLVSWAGRLAWEKADSAEVFLSACQHLKRRKHPDLQVVVAGSGRDMHRIEKLSHNLQKSSSKRYIHVIGEQPDLRALYATSQCVVGTGRVALEALACRRLVVAAGSRGLFGLVTPSNFTDAWYYYFGDHRSVQDYTPANMADCIHQGLMLDARKRRSWERAGRTFVRRLFDVERIANEHVHLYQLCRNSRNWARSSR